MAYRFSTRPLSRQRPAPAESLTFRFSDGPLSKHRPAGHSCRRTAGALCARTSEFLVPSLYSPCSQGLSSWWSFSPFSVHISPRNCGDTKKKSGSWSKHVLRQSSCRPHEPTPTAAAPSALGARSFMTLPYGGYCPEPHDSHMHIGIALSKGFLPSTAIATLGGVMQGGGYPQSTLAVCMRGYPAMRIYVVCFQPIDLL